MIVFCRKCGHVFGPPRYPTDMVVPYNAKCDFCELTATLNATTQKLRQCLSKARKAANK